MPPRVTEENRRGSDTSFDGTELITGSGHPFLRTENDLKNKFVGGGFSSGDSDGVTFRQAFRKDVSDVRRFARTEGSSFSSWFMGLFTFSGFLSAATELFPVIRTLRTYKIPYMIPDTGAGLVEGIMKVPSGLAYALLAGMPSQYGLYTSLLPPFIYMCMGTCTQVSFGVTAIEALFLGESVRGIVGDDIYEAKASTPQGEQHIQFTLFFSFCVGLWQLAFRLFRLDFISSLLADPVLSGFSTGGAFIIFTSQLPSMLGITLDHANDEFLPAAWAEACRAFDEWNWCSIGMCCTSMVLLVVLQILTKKYLNGWPVPWQVVIVILSIIVTVQMDLHEKYGLKLIGHIPRGFPQARFPSMPTIEGESKSSLFAKTIFPSLLAGLFVYVMSLSLGTLFAGKNGYKVKPRKEITAIGTASVLSSMCGAFICSASFSRTAVVHALGAKTTLHGIPALIIMILTLTLLTGPLENLPKTILASIIIVAVWPMLEFKHGIKYYCLNKVEFFVWIVTFVVCLCEGAMIGIYTGVGVSLLVMIWRTARPSTVVLGKLPGTTIYRNLKRFPNAEEIPGVKIVRFDGSLYFANWSVFQDALENVTNPDIHTIVVDASSINSIDTSSVRGLLELLETFSRQGVSILFANWKGPERDFLQRANFYKHVKEDTLFLCLHDAVSFARKSKTDRGDISTTPSSTGKAVVELGGEGDEIKWKVDYSPTV